MSQKPIRILHVIGIMNRGGAEVMIMNLYRNIDREKIQFDFVENSFEPAAFDEEIRALGGRIYRCPHYNGKNHFTYKKWWDTFFKEHHAEYKAVHGHLGSTASIYLKKAKRYGMYTIAHSHSTTGKGMKNYLYQMYSHSTRYIADYFFACSRDAGITRYGDKTCTDTSKFSVLKNAIDTSVFQYDEQVRTEERKKFQVENKIVIGNVGRFVTVKNHSFLIDIFEQIHKINTETVLLLVGDGKLRNTIQEKITQRGLENAVIFAGVQENVSEYYQLMDVFVLPSLYEGLGIVVVEAQCSGLPCVISDKVSKECIVTTNQVDVCGLEDSAEQWAKVILEKTDVVRSDSSEQVKQNGYDISETSKWLSQFYLEEI